MHTDAKDQVEKLVKRRAIIDATLHRIKARSRAENRKQDTRRKILIGALILNEMEKDPERVGAWVKKLLATKLTKARDRVLFDLPTATPE